MPKKSLPLSLSQVAEQTGIPKRTLHYAISLGDLKAHKMAGETGAYLVYPSDLDNYVAKRAAKAATS